MAAQVHDHRILIYTLLLSIYVLIAVMSEVSTTSLCT